MRRQYDGNCSSEKNRIRDEIDRQVRAYLQQGGKIEVLSATNRQVGSLIGSVWHGSEDLPGIGQ